MDDVELAEAAGEGREFLKLITDVDHDTIDDEDVYEDSQIAVWLEEMDYEWNGGSWVATR